MLSFLIIHTNQTVSRSIELILEKYNASIEKCLGYNRSEPIFFAQHQKPAIVFMERRFSIDETESVMYRFNYLSPKSKFYLLATNLNDKHILKSSIKQKFEDIISDCEVHTSVQNLLDDLYLKISQTCLVSKQEHIKANLNKLTKTEYEIYLDLSKNMNAKDISLHRGIAHDTANKHIKHILKKLNVHSRKDFIDNEL